MMQPTDDFTVAAKALAADGWCSMPQLMSMAQTRALAQECAALHEGKVMLPAGTGRAHSRSPLRGDHTLWFPTAALTAPQQVFQRRIDSLRIALNRSLFLGLVDTESHYAVYSPGSGYARHLDRIHDSDARVISAVFYLNDHWRESDGGALRLYLPDQSSRDIYPHAGTLLLFLSAQFEHQVLPATRQRMSIACWMRQQGVGATC
ncbi:MAG: 2OG-Fe(II) oxygenase [Rhodanobacter sp.]|nr:MAG: 2OG-Fe(II) oxygenase [Rhodanobacter sp.]